MANSFPSLEHRRFLYPRPRPTPRIPSTALPRRLTKQPAASDDEWCPTQDQSDDSCSRSSHTSNADSSHQELSSQSGKQNQATDHPSPPRPEHGHPSTSQRTFNDCIDAPNAPACYNDGDMSTSCLQRFCKL